MTHPIPDVRALVARAALVAVLVGGVAACGDDDTTADEPTTEADNAATDNEAACSALVDFNAAASADSDTSTPEGATELATQLEPLWADASAAMPESSADDVAVITDAIADMKAGDPTAFEADATFATYTTLLTAAVDSCGFATTAVSATEAGGEYAFEGLPDTLDAGTYALTLKNEGAEDHVIILFRKNDGETRSAEELLALSEEEGQKTGTEQGAVFAPPGAESVGLADLTPGDYVYFCPIPIGDNGPPHFTAGMYGEFTVS